MSKPSILFVINSLGGGGAERVMATLLNFSASKQADFRIGLVLLDREHIAYPPPSWVEVHQLDCKYSALNSIIALHQLVRREQPDIVCSFLTRSNVASYFASRGSGRPFLMSERSNTRAQLGGGFRGLVSRNLVRLSYPNADAIISVSKGVADGLSRDFAVPPERITTIYNPVDVEAIRAAAERDSAVALDGPYIVAAGRLEPVKNFDLLLRAFARSHFRGKLVIAGEGPERGRLEHLVAELHLAGRVVMPGFVANPFPLIAGATLFALSSHSEGFPNAMLEALALSVPVVATNCGHGPAEILAGTTAANVHGTLETPAGFLTPVGDVEAFAHALDLAVSARDRLAPKTSELVEQYSPQATVSRYWSVISEAMRARQG